ncbi:dehydrogenase/reductase SDR family member 13 isoform X1 [Trichosurus vulpecula]|uniref:dehydrogenase/reductase SDR family member 13 isoform X1 n=1 Tax=Trichosurus vulpecula TaxID=9337 RepID=UPI00186AE9BA|nr:dehydrogenase/reductase SDR family member 13 isoform X1 [Trichosurus vulpecula]
MDGLLLGAGMLLGSYVLIYYNFIKAVPCMSPISLKGKTVVVTGGNTGIGKMTALELAQRGARVVLACRSKEKGEAAVYDIRKGSGPTGKEVEGAQAFSPPSLHWCLQESGNNEVIFMMLDLSSLASVHSFATAFLSSEPRLDLLIHNAGISSCGKAKEAFNLILRVNHVGPFLLTHLLLPRLKANAPSRVVVMASAAHRRGRLDFSRLDRPVCGWQQELRAYADSKLANVLFTRELATQLEGTGVTCYAAHPGPVNSELFLRHVPAWLHLLLSPLAWLVLRTPRGGAQTPLHCALQEGIEPLSGRYFANCHVEEVATSARDDRTARRLWEASEKLARLTKEGTQNTSPQPGSPRRPSAQVTTDPALSRFQN